MKSSVGPALPRLQIVAAAVLFATGGVLIKATDLDAWQVAGGRSIVAAVLFAVVYRVGLSAFSRRGLVAGLFYGATMVGFVVANKLTTASNSIFLQNTAPLYILVVAPLLLGESRRRWDGWVAAVLATGLLCFFAGADPAFETAPDPALGNVIAAVDGVFWAGTLLSLRWLSRREEGAIPAALVIGNVFAVLVALPFSAPVALSAADVAVVGYLGAIQIVAAYLFMVAGMRRVAAFEAAMLLMLEPVLSTLLAWAVYGERPGVWSIFGSILILFATGLKSAPGYRSDPPIDSGAAET